MLQCSDILHRTAINFQISYLKLNTNILHIADMQFIKVTHSVHIYNNIICVHFV